MVKIGDRIKLEDGRKVKVMGIEKNHDERYVIVFLDRFVEGDIDFEVIQD